MSTAPEGVTGRFVEEGGVGPRVGGEAASETPEEPAVEGRVSALSTGEGGVLRGAGFLRVGTPSGQVH